MGKEIRIEREGNFVKLWVDGEEVKDILQLRFEATQSQDFETVVTCSYWKFVRDSNGLPLVLNNNLVTEQVVVSE